MEHCLGSRITSLPSLSSLSSLPPSLPPSLPANSEEVETLRAVIQDLEVQIEGQKLKIQNTTNALLRVSCLHTDSWYPPTFMYLLSYAVYGLYFTVKAVEITFSDLFVAVRWREA